MDSLLNVLGLGLGDRDSTLRHSTGYAVAVLAVAGVVFAVGSLAPLDLTSLPFAVGGLSMIHAGTSGEDYRDYLPRWGAALAAMIVAGLLLGLL